MEMITVTLSKDHVRVLHAFLVEHHADLLRMVMSVNGVPRPTAEEHARRIADNVERPLLPSSDRSLGTFGLRPVTVEMAEGLAIVVGGVFEQTAEIVALSLAQTADCKISEAKIHIDNVIDQCTTIQKRLEEEEGKKA